METWRKTDTWILKEVTENEIQKYEKKQMEAIQNRNDWKVEGEFFVQE